LIRADNLGRGGENQIRRRPSCHPPLATPPIVTLIGALPNRHDY
jgi:hypothetical protein